MVTKSKFSLSASPTFKDRVSIPVPGGKSTDVEFTFKHKTREQFKEFVEGLKDREDTDVILEIASGWDLEDAFDDTAVDAMIENYIGSARAIIEKYIGSLTGARSGN